MIYVNDKLTSVPDLVELVKGCTGKSVSLDVLKKNTAFIVNPLIQAIDLGKTNQRGVTVMKRGQGAEILSSFRIFNDNDGNSYTIRYAQTAPYNRGGNIVYTPGQVSLAPEVHDVLEGDGKNLDLLLYIYLHPRNKQSPFRDKDKPYQFEHINSDDIISEKIGVAQEISDAIEHSQKLGQVELAIFARALGINTKGLSSSQISGLVMLEAAKNTDHYNKIKNDRVKQFVAAINQAIDDGAIKSEKINNSYRWTFAEGVSKGMEILVTSPHTKSAKKDLIDYISANPDRYYSHIRDLSRSSVTSKNLNEFLKDNDPLADSSQPEQYVPIEDAGVEGIPPLSSVVSTATAGEYLRNISGGYNAAPTNQKAFFEAVESGEINDQNVLSEFHKYLSAEYRKKMGIE